MRQQAKGRRAMIPSKLASMGDALRNPLQGLPAGRAVRGPIRCKRCKQDDTAVEIRLAQLRGVAHLRGAENVRVRTGHWNAKGKLA